MGSPHASPMVEDYLSIIWKAREWPGRSVSTNEIASTQSVTPSSVSANLKKLARDGLIEYTPSHPRATISLWQWCGATESWRPT
jgi:DtxR family Mn-dependent transcriptional regulator